MGIRVAVNVDKIATLTTNSEAFGVCLSSFLIFRTYFQSGWLNRSLYLSRTASNLKCLITGNYEMSDGIAESILFFISCNKPVFVDGNFRNV